MMCARLIPHQLAGSRSSLNGSKGSPADVNFSSSASYRVLRSGRQRPWRSVNRKVTGRNASEATEPRQIVNRAWTPSLYRYGEGNTSRLFGAWRSTGVQENSMLPRLMQSTQGNALCCEGTEEVQSVSGRNGNRNTYPRVLSQGCIIPTLDVRWRNGSEEIG